MISFVGITRISGKNVKKCGWTNLFMVFGLPETGNVRVITHDADLEEFFPGNELVSDDTR